MMRTILALLLCNLPALANSQAPDCRALNEFLKRASDDGAWVTPLTDRELDFARGLYAQTPTTPTDIPPGDAAKWIDFQNPDGGIMIVFVDGKRVCEPMSITKAARELFRKLGQKPSGGL